MPKIKNKRKSKKLNGKISAGDKNEEVQIREEPAISAVQGGMPIVFSWTTVDFIKSPITEFYYIAAAVGSMAMIGWGIYDKNFIMIVTFIFVVVLIIMALNEEPKKVDVKISENGIDLNSEHYSYNEFGSFRISHVDGMLAIILKPRKSFIPFRTIYIVDQPVNDLEMFLRIYLERDEDDENIEKGKAGGEEGEGEEDEKKEE